MGPGLLLSSNFTLQWMVKLSKGADWLVDKIKFFAGEHPVAQVCFNNAIVKLSVCLILHKFYLLMYPSCLSTFYCIL